mmetsp:Transcript_33646/g.106866  ORF Transcript_33646/g.106866 Transcript_33646/m.106866 type:complete len:230 (-) Transcript_33646:37-726(-)
MRRTRHLRPPPQDAEHSPHCPQSPHMPSTHCAVPQGCVWQGTISLLTCTEHFLPLPSGETLMWRSRVFCPPPQLHVQALQSDQSSHSQSMPCSHLTVCLHAARHSLVSMMLCEHGFPQWLFGCWTPRWRMQSPVQSASLQSLHGATLQSTGAQLSQGSLLHSLYLTSLPSHAACLLTTQGLSPPSTSSAAVSFLHGFSAAALAGARARISRRPRGRSSMGAPPQWAPSA